MTIELGCNKRPDPVRPVEVVRNDRDRDRRLCCVAQQVHRIDQLQKEAMLEESCLRCSTHRLGDNNLERRRPNTRPFTLIFSNGEELEVRIEEPFDVNTRRGLQEPVKLEGCRNRDEDKSKLFRVENVDGNCATLRALKRHHGHLKATCFCVTVELCCFCAIQCFEDVCIKNLNCCEEED